ncbi:MAG: GntP family permease [Saprospiraceae bacterium]|nr:GntP family permease [Saprospiraceae bacterium]
MYVFILLALSIAWIVISSGRYRMHPIWSLLGACGIVGFGTGLSLPAVIETVSSGFGSLLGGIGLIIVLGAVLGVILDQTGGAITLANVVLRTIGKKFPGLAMGSIGALVSIPVFCDSAYIVLSRINHALAGKTHVSPSTLFLALAGGLYLTHNLIPPTPGPVAAAGNLALNANLGQIIILGVLISIPVLGILWLWSRFIGKRIVLTPMADRETPETEQELPTINRVLPVLGIPILLMALGTVFPSDSIGRWIAIPEFALFLGVVLAFALLGQGHKQQWRKWTESGIKLAGPILIITGMGGSFGAILKKTSLVEVVTRWMGNEPTGGWVLLVAAFGLAALLKTAQGSSTSALVVGSSVFAPFLATMDGLSIWQQALTVTSLGAGAMVVSHANDSYFWVVTQFSGIQINDAYRSYTIMTFIMGLSTLILCLLAFFCLDLIFMA